MCIVKSNVKSDYEQYVKRKVLATKKEIYKKWQKRSDFDAILHV